MEKIVGRLDEEEAKNIRQLYEKKMALENLIKIIEPDNEAMYTKVTDDYTNVMSLFQSWWDSTSKKYEWETVEGGHWRVNFDTYEVVLVG